jgi:putative tricarboxylic transport membrane protein
LSQRAGTLLLQVLVPTGVFVGTIGFLGIYLAAALFITFFMLWLGRYSLAKALPVGIMRKSNSIRMRE